MQEGRPLDSELRQVDAHVASLVSDMDMSEETGRSRGGSPARKSSPPKRKSSASPDVKGSLRHASGADESNGATEQGGQNSSGNGGVKEEGLSEGDSLEKKAAPVQAAERGSELGLGIGLGLGGAVSAEPNSGGGFGARISLGGVVSTEPRRGRVLELDLNAPLEETGAGEPVRWPTLKGPDSSTRSPPPASAAVVAPLLQIGPQRGFLNLEPNSEALQSTERSEGQEADTSSLEQLDRVIGSLQQLYKGSAGPFPEKSEFVAALLRELNEIKGGLSRAFQNKASPPAHVPPEGIHTTHHEWGVIHTANHELQQRLATSKTMVEQRDEVIRQLNVSMRSATQAKESALQRANELEARAAANQRTIATLSSEVAECRETKRLMVAAMEPESDPDARAAQTELLQKRLHTVLNRWRLGGGASKTPAPIQIPFIAEPTVPVPRPTVTVAVDPPSRVPDINGLPPFLVPPSLVNLPIMPVPSTMLRGGRMDPLPSQIRPPSGASNTVPLRTDRTEGALEISHPLLRNGSQPVAEPRAWDVKPFPGERRGVLPGGPDMAAWSALGAPRGASSPLEGHRLEAAMREWYNTGGRGGNLVGSGGEVGRDNPSPQNSNSNLSDLVGSMEWLARRQQVQQYPPRAWGSQTQLSGGVQTPLQMEGDARQILEASLSRPLAENSPGIPLFGQLNGAFGSQGHRARLSPSQNSAFSSLASRGAISPLHPPPSLSEILARPQGSSQGGGAVSSPSSTQLEKQASGLSQEVTKKRSRGSRSVRQKEGGEDGNFPDSEDGTSKRGTKPRGKRDCPDCGTLLAAAAADCPKCGHVFRPSKWNTRAGQGITDESPQVLVRTTPQRLPSEGSVLSQLTLRVGGGQSRSHSEGGGSRDDASDRRRRQEPGGSIHGSIGGSLLSHPGGSLPGGPQGSLLGDPGGSLHGGPGESVHGGRTFANEKPELSLPTWWQTGAKDVGGGGHAEGMRGGGEERFGPGHLPGHFVNNWAALAAFTVRGFGVQVPRGQTGGLTVVAAEVPGRRLGRGGEITGLLLGGGARLPALEGGGLKRKADSPQGESPPARSGPFTEMYNWGNQGGNVRNNVPGGIDQGDTKGPGVDLCLGSPSLGQGIGARESQPPSEATAAANVNRFNLTAAQSASYNTAVLSATDRSALGWGRDLDLSKR